MTHLNFKPSDSSRQTNVEGYYCFRCSSDRVRIYYPDIQCLSCGWSEPLLDFPVSWSFHRHYAREFGMSDPGPCELPEHTVGELHERLEALENRLGELSLSDTDLKRLGLMQVKTEIAGLRLGLRGTQRILTDVVREKIRIRRKRPKTYKLELDL